LDAEEASVGLEADLPKRREVTEPLADREVAGVVDGGLGSKGPAFLEVLLAPGVLVVDVQRWHHPFRDDPGPEPPGGLLGDAAVEDQGDLGGTSQVQVLFDHLLEEHPAR
jgi:hypothetical protein